MWFVRQGGTLYLVPVTGTESQWYRNILATPAIRVAAAGTQYATDAVPVRDAGNVAEILDAFRAKYGTRDVASYYRTRTLQSRSPSDLAFVRRLLPLPPPATSLPDGSLRVDPLG